MVRIVVGDVPSLTVIRDGAFTLIVRPAVYDLADGVRDARMLLTPEEAAIVRAAMGVPDGESCERYAGVAPALTCPCYIPASMRVSIAVTPCPLHADIVASLRA